MQIQKYEYRKTWLVLHLPIVLANSNEIKNTNADRSNTENTNTENTNILVDRLIDYGCKLCESQWRRCLVELLLVIPIYPVWPAQAFGICICNCILIYICLCHCICTYLCSVICICIYFCTCICICFCNCINIWWRYTLSSLSCLGRPSIQSCWYIREIANEEIQVARQISRCQIEC